MTEEQFEYALKYGKRKSDVNNKDINVLELPFCFIKWEFMQLANESLQSSVLKCLEYLKIESKSLTIKEVNAIFLYLYDEIITEKGLIHRLEKQFLSSEPDVDMIAAGQNRLAPFNNLLTLYNLANKDYFVMKKLESEPYGTLLDLQAMLKTQSEVQSRYQEIKINKNKK